MEGLSAQRKALDKLLARELNDEALMLTLSYKSMKREFYIKNHEHLLLHFFHQTHHSSSFQRFSTKLALKLVAQIYWLLFRTNEFVKC